MEIFNVRDFVSLDYLLGICRILFGVMLVVKFFYSYRARRVVWAHRLPFGSESVLRVLLIVQLFLSVLFILGVFAFPVTVLLCVNYLYLFKSASLYGLEDVVFHMFTFYWVMAAGKSDIALELPGLPVELSRFTPFGETLIPELVLAAMAGSIFCQLASRNSTAKCGRKVWGLTTFSFFPTFADSIHLGLCITGGLRAL